MPNYLVLRRCDDGRLTDPIVHYDCPDPETAAAQSNPGEPCTLVVGEWEPAEYALRHEPVIEPVEVQAE